MTNQILVATSFDEARVGTIGADVEHYAPWRDAAPCSLDDVRKELSKAPATRCLARDTGGGSAAAHEPAGRNPPLYDPIKWCRVARSRSCAVIRSIARYMRRWRGFRPERLGVAMESMTDAAGLIWHTQGIGQEPEHGLSGAQAALDSGAAEVQSRACHRPHRLAKAAQQDRNRHQ